MSKRPPGVKVGDRVRITTTHAGTVTRINDDSFVLETNPGRPMHGNFHGDGEMTWVVLRDPEPFVGSVVLDRDGLAWQRAAIEFGDQPWWAASDDPDLSWAQLDDQHGPLTVIHKAEPLC